jgi:hypothetical protein
MEGFGRADKYMQEADRTMREADWTYCVISGLPHGCLPHVILDRRFSASRLIWQNLVAWSLSSSNMVLPPLSPRPIRSPYLTSE